MIPQDCRLTRRPSCLTNGVHLTLSKAYRQTRRSDEADRLDSDHVNDPELRKRADDYMTAYDDEVPVSDLFNEYYELHHGFL